MTQPIKLQLTTEAIAALFPEGTQARVELQNAVVAEFCRKNVKPSLLGVEIQLAAAQKAAAEEVLKDLGIKRDSWNKSVLTDDMKALIRNRVHTEFSSTASELCRQAALSIKDDIHASVNARVTKLVDDEIAAAVKARVQEVAKGVLGG